MLLQSLLKKWILVEMRLFSHACKCLNSYIKLGYSEIEHNINTYKSLSGPFPFFIPFSRLSPLQAKQS